MPKAYAIDAFGLERLKLTDWPAEPLPFGHVRIRRSRRSASIGAIFCWSKAGMRRGCACRRSRARTRPAGYLEIGEGCGRFAPGDAVGGHHVSGLARRHAQRGSAALGTRRTGAPGHPADRDRAAAGRRAAGSGPPHNARGRDVTLALCGPDGVGGAGEIRPAAAGTDRADSNTLCCRANWFGWSCYRPSTIGRAGGFQARRSTIPCGLCSPWISMVSAGCIVALAVSSIAS